MGLPELKCLASSLTVGSRSEIKTNVCEVTDADSWYLLAPLHAFLGLQSNLRIHFLSVVIKPRRPDPVRKGKVYVHLGVWRLSGRTDAPKPFCGEVCVLSGQGLL